MSARKRAGERPRLVCMFQSAAYLDRRVPRHRRSAVAGTELVVAIHRRPLRIRHLGGSGREARAYQSERVDAHRQSFGTDRGELQGGRSRCLSPMQRMERGPLRFGGHTTFRSVSAIPTSRGPRPRPPRRSGEKSCTTVPTKSLSQSHIWAGRRASPPWRPPPPRPPAGGGLSAPSPVPRTSPYR